MKAFEITMNLPVKPYHIDFAGVVNNAVYVRWMDDLRLAVLEKYFPLEIQMAQGYAPFIIKTEIEYKSALRLFDKPVGNIWVTDMQRLKFFVEAEFKLGNKLIARAIQTGVFGRLTDGRPVRVPLDLIDKFKSYQ